MPEKEIQETEVKEEEIKETQEEETPEEKSEDKIVYTQVIQGTEVKLTEEQLNRVVYLGLQAAHKMAEEREKPKPTIEKKEEKKDPEKATNKEVQDLKADLSKKEQRQVNIDIEENFEDQEIGGPYFEKMLKEQAFIAIATAMQKDEPYSARRICKQLIKAHKEQMEKLTKPKVNLKEKEEDKNKTKLEGKGKGAGDESPKPLTRKAFKDGSLAKQVAAHLEKLGEH
jgi:hypothetical protein